MSGTHIQSIHARHIIDCKTRGLVEVDVVTESGALGRASAPTGTSVGSMEAYVLRDPPETARFAGTSAYAAVRMVNEVIAPALIGMDVMDQAAIDQRMLEMDGTFRKEKLGGNSIYGVSAACMRARAAVRGHSLAEELRGDTPIRTLPVPISNMFNGGRYGSIEMDFQEFGVVPYGAADMQEAVDIIVTTFQMVRKMLEEQGKPIGIANYFGHMPFSNDARDLFSMIAEAVDRCGYTDKVCYYADCAAGELYDPQRGTYRLMGKETDTDGMIGYLCDLTSRFPFYAIEDVVADHDFAGYAKAARAMPDVRIVGDDLICTNPVLLRRAIDEKACRGMIFKPNQAGTVTECLEAYRLARESGLTVIPSVRAGGAVDDPVKEMAVGLQADLVKCGAPRSGERVSFLAELMRAGDLYPDAKLRPLPR